MSAGSKRNNTRQQEIGAAAREETRRRLVVAAGEEFAQSGYTAATVGRIAKRAGVSVQTLYLACGSKRELLRSYMVMSLYGDQPSIEQITSRVTAPEPEAMIGQIAELFRELSSRAGRAWSVYREAAAVDAAIATDWQELHALRRGAFGLLLAPIPDEALRLPRPDAIDTAWAVASPEMYDLLVTRSGYSLDRFEAWLAATLRGALLSSPAAA